MVNLNLNFRFRPHRQCHLELKVEVEFKVRTWMSAAVFLELYDVMYLHIWLLASGILVAVVGGL